MVQRNTQTVRAHEARNGEEKWNFSVSLHDLAFHPGQELCDDEVDDLEVADEELEDNCEIGDDSVSSLSVGTIFTRL